MICVSFRPYQFGPSHIYCMVRPCLRSMTLICSIAGAGIEPSVSINRFTSAPDWGSMSWLIFRALSRNSGSSHILSYAFW